mmetsp:Transcript_40211/g.111726  ORF Transcript_40211/g.111726 Transcript_40211/m.111726 type:complete len:315 (-) Transcript_40211:58-1002(-)
MHRVGTVPGQHHRMVHRRITLAPIEDPFAVGVPRRGVNGHNQWACRRNRPEQRLEPVLWQPHEALDPGTRLGWLTATAVTAGGVALVAACVSQAMFSNVFEGKLRSGTLATAVSTAMLLVRHAIDQLFVGELAGRSASDLGVHLQGPHSCHCPAGAACALVPNKGARMVELLTPIDCFSQSSPLLLFQEGSNCWRWRLCQSTPMATNAAVTQHSEALNICEVCEPVDLREPPRVRQRIVRLHLRSARLKECKPCRKWHGILEARLPGPVLPAEGSVGARAPGPVGSDVPQCSNNQQAGKYGSHSSPNREQSCPT